MCVCCKCGQDDACLVPRQGSGPCSLVSTAYRGVNGRSVKLLYSIQYRGDERVRLCLHCPVLLHGVVLGSNAQHYLGCLCFLTNRAGWTRRNFPATNFWSLHNSDVLQTDSSHLSCRLPRPVLRLGSHFYILLGSCPVPVDEMSHTSYW